MGKKGGKKKDSASKGHEEEPSGPSKYLNDMENTDAWDNRHALYQRAVQSPKGDISYLLKFFLTYVGGRVPLHLREDFCGTALICAEWLQADARRTATGLDLDDDALAYGLRHNLPAVPNGAEGRICLLLGNVLEPGAPADIICAFNFSTCCLHVRADLLRYLRHARASLARRGGVFAMDLYGGASSECALKLRRRYGDFTVRRHLTFLCRDILLYLTRMTRISLHFRLEQSKRTIRRAFSYQWRLWTIPEVRECLQEAGFETVRVWMRAMPDLGDREDDDDEVDVDPKSKYVETASFLQCDAWNAYVVAVARGGGA
eukprot:jgi/Mesen1/8234/ME000443S07385